MAGSPELMKKALTEQKDESSPLHNADLSALVPNPRGMQDALDAGVKRARYFRIFQRSFRAAKILTAQFKRASRDLKK